MADQYIEGDDEDEQQLLEEEATQDDDMHDEDSEFDAASLGLCNESA